jgi:hypothetical protein
MPDNTLPSGSPDPISQMIGGGAGVSNADIQQALSPSMQRGPIQMPSYFTTPRKEMLPPATMDHRQVVGAGNARAQGIGNAVSASVRTLSNFVAKRDQQKQMAEATKVQRFLSAQYEADQATQILKGDPNNKEALAARQQADTLMAGMLQGPDGAKFTKTLEKGFQISLTDPSQNKTEPHSIVQKGIDLFKKQHSQPPNTEQAQQAVQRFRQQMPQQLGPNQQKLQELQTKAALQKSQNDFLAKIYPSIIRAQGAENLAKFSADSKYRIEQYKQGNENSRAFAKILGDFERDRQKNVDARNLAMLKADLITKRLDHVLGSSALQPGKLIPERNTYDRQMSELEINQQTLIRNLMLDRDSAKDKAAVNTKIKAAEDDLKTIKDTHSTGLTQFDDLISGKVTFGGKPIDSSSKSNDGGSASTGSSGAGPADKILGADNLQDIYKELTGPEESSDDQ